MPKQPKKKDFQADPRANQIRTICIEIADALNNLLHKRDTPRIEEQARLVVLKTQLESLGIIKSMKVGLTPEKYEDPCTMAEWVAGQTLAELNTLGEIPSESSIVPILKEFSEPQQGEALGVHLIQGKNLHPKVANFIVIRESVSFIHQFFDTRELVSKDEYLQWKKANFPNRDYENLQGRTIEELNRLFITASDRMEEYETGCHMAYIRYNDELEMQLNRHIRYNDETRLLEISDDSLWQE